MNSLHFSSSSSSKLYLKCGSFYLTQCKFVLFDAVPVDEDVSRIKVISTSESTHSEGSVTDVLTYKQYDIAGLAGLTS